MCDNNQYSGDFVGKIALVTGASRGIGREIALNLAKQGAIVVGSATTQQGADGITSEFNKSEYNNYNFNDKNFGIQLDLADKESISNAMEKMSKLVGYPDILVNNAGITADNLFLRMSTDEWDKVIATNLSGVFNLTKYCLKSMLKSRWGRIINVSSVVAASGNAGQVNYAAAKSGLIGFTKSLAQEVAKRGVTVNALAPGFIATDMTSKLPEDHTKQLLQQIPMNRIGKAAEIAAAVSFLASAGASYITGSTLHVNGGMYMC